MFQDTRAIFLNGQVSKPISLELIKELHRILTEGAYDELRCIEKGERPGEFKKHSYVTGIMAFDRCI